MMQRTYTLNDLNREGLHLQLTQALDGLYRGFAARQTPESVIVSVNLADSATPRDIDRLNALMAAHDPAQQTPDQQARAAQQQKLAQARRDYASDALNPADYAGQDALIQALARKIAWLEQEVIHLRDA